MIFKIELETINEKTGKRYQELHLVQAPSEKEAKQMMWEWYQDHWEIAWMTAKELAMDTPLLLRKQEKC